MENTVINSFDEFKAAFDSGKQVYFAPAGHSWTKVLDLGAHMNFMNAGECTFDGRQIIQKDDSRNFLTQPVDAVDGNLKTVYNYDGYCGKLGYFCYE